MEKISPTVNIKASLKNEKIFNCQESINQSKDLKSSFFMNSLYDSFNFLNLKTIGDISKALLSAESLKVICLESLKKEANSFTEKLLFLGLPINEIESKKNKTFYVYFDISNKDADDLKFILKKKRFVVSNKKKFKGETLRWAKSSNSLKITPEEKLEVFLNCLYMNLLTNCYCH